MCERVLGGPAGAEVGVGMGVDWYPSVPGVARNPLRSKGVGAGQEGSLPKAGVPGDCGWARAGAEAVWRVFPWAGPPPRMKALSPARTLVIWVVGRWGAVGDPSGCQRASGSQGSEEACALWRPVWTVDTETPVSAPRAYLPSSDGCPALGSEGSWKPSWRR